MQFQNYMWIIKKPFQLKGWFHNRYEFLKLHNRAPTPILLALHCCIDYNGVVTDIHISHQGDGDPKIGGIVLCCKK